MSNAFEIFMKGVNFAEWGDIFKVKRRDLDYRVFYYHGYLLQKEAALRQQSEERCPLHRYVMMQSAAALAYKAQHFEEALETIALCRMLAPDDYTLSRLDQLEELSRKALAARSQNGAVPSENGFARLTPPTQTPPRKTAPGTACASPPGLR